MRLHWICGCLLVLAWPAAASERAQSVAAARTAAPIVLDGRLDEAAWARAIPIDRFYETYPGARVAAPERTEVRLLYDDDNLYVGLRLWLKDPSRLRKPFVRRDQVNYTHDYAQIYLDPQGSRRGSYLFRVNARGTRTDGYQDEAQETETLDPDYDWDVVSHIDAYGWSAEIRIPLSTLRIAHSGAQRWAVVVTRGVPREQNTQMASAPFPHDSNCFLCYAGTVSFADLSPHAERLIATPGLTLTQRHDEGGFGRRRGLDTEPSLDAKWLPGDADALDVTVNPDFSQVEADVAQLTANQRFALDLPEKRPFFREGADLVATAIPAVYTRSIAAPDYGLRYTHRSAGLEGTGFVAHDGGRAAIIEPGFLGSSLGLPAVDSDVGFGRLRDTLAHGDVGALAALKRNDDGSRNSVAGVDASWSSDSDRVLGQWLDADTRNPRRPDLLPTWRGQSLHGGAMLLEWDHSTANVWSLRYERYGPGFRSWLGYVPRVGYQLLHGEYYRPFYSTAKWLNTIEPYLSMDRLDGVGGNRGHESDPALGLVLSGYKSFSADVSWHSRAMVLDGDGHQRHTDFVAWQLSASPGPRLPLVAVTGQRGRIVDYATGEVVPGATVGWRMLARPLDRLELEARYDRDTLDGLAGQRRHLTEDALQWFGTWHVTARMYVLVTWQRYSSARDVPARQREHHDNASLQFNWNASRDLQLYWGLRYGSARGQEPASDGRGRELYFKVSYTLRR
ncbi:MAG TPA: DUF5916 domain-containing protein [Frateuria sp.]|uniref:carbohydrate binding family 9 domain-containing protein n=1 Tax=Frateuria sp. TaxID=2211372 RepID=UPI002D7E5875|nr:DUF5916 domain-containing protein [Frateuria sp.]HET6806583.1 DUF5916 domain-containing protein [Frateuria sp.]